MKKLKFILLLFAVVEIIPAKAQQGVTSTCSADYFCSKNLNSAIFPDASILIDAGIGYGKYPNSGDVRYSNENDGCIGVAACDTGDIGSLYYDVYYPSSYLNYATCPLPAIIFFYGGGYKECIGIGSNSDVCRAFARRGFVVFNVEYRRGRTIIPPPSIYTSVQLELAAYRVFQDVRGAIRSILQRQIEQNNLPANEPHKPYQFNTNLIFLAGESAGSIGMLNAAYYTDPQMNYDIFPNVANGTTIKQALGPIDADYYYGNPGMDYISHIKGVLDIAGSVSLPPSYHANQNEIDFFNHTPHPPVISFHGNLDPIVPINDVPVRFAPFAMTAYFSESSCVKQSPFKTDKTDNIDLYSYGSQAFFDKVLQPLHIPSELYIDCQMKHTLDCEYNPPGCPTQFQSDFGTGYTTQADVEDYIVGRATTFFQLIISGDAQTRQDDATTHKVFIECRNKRNTCSLANNDNNCGTPIPCSNQ